jgi:arabinoxylan arabinofuranohydrolase
MGPRPATLEDDVVAMTRSDASSMSVRDRNRRKERPFVYRVKRAAALLVGVMVLASGVVLASPPAAEAANPYLPEWEHVPDGEPHVFEDPDQPGAYRLYIYGSHDTNMTSYCGTDLVLWSAPVEDLNDWRYEGRIFEYTAPGASTPDTFYAPDIAEVEEEQADGSTRKAYYLYPQDTAAGRGSMVAKSYSPKGPFEVINWADDTKTRTTGSFGFDPALFIDDDGKVYGYWGFQQSNAAQMQDNMYQIVPETKVTDMIASSNSDDVWRFFEGSSVRKIDGKYVFIYARKTRAGEAGLGTSNATLAYAYGDSPLGPWTYGGTLVDARAPETGENGEPIATMPSNNTHGSLVEVDGQWYVFYHRAVSGAYARQSTAEPVEITVTENGALTITQAEVTSEGLETAGLDPAATTSAGIASWITGGSQIPRIDNPAYPNPSGQTAPVTNNVNGSIVGYKYFSFDDDPAAGATTELTVNLTPKGVDGTIDIMLDRPWANASNAGTKIGSIDVRASDARAASDYTARVSGLDAVDGKHAIYFVFRSATGGQSIADLHNFTFGERDVAAGTKVDVISIRGGAVVDGRGTVAAGTTTALTADVQPSDAADASVTWSSSNANVVAVGADGTVSGVNAGSAIVTATANDGSGVRASLPFDVVSTQLIANGSFDNSNDPWTVVKAAGGSTVVANTGYSTRYGTSGRSFNPKTRVYDGDAAQYPLAGKLGVGKTYAVSARVLYKASENPSSGTGATFSVVLIDRNGTSAVVSTGVTRETWNEVAGDITIPDGFDVASAVLQVVTGDPAAPQTRTPISSFFLDEVSLKERLTVSSDATLSAFSVAGQAVDLAEAATPGGASVTVPDPSMVGPADVAATPTSARAAANVTVAAGVVTVSVAAQDGSTDIYRVTLAKAAVPVTAITVEALAGSVGVGESVPFVATVTPSDADDPGVTWSSSDESVATVDGSGVVTGISAGVVTITATAVDGSGVSGSAALTVIGDDVAPPAESPSVSVSLSSGAVSPGERLTVTASGLAANEQVEVWLHSTPVRLISGIASADGAYTATVTIPTTTALGDHRIEVRGLSSGSSFAALRVEGVEGVDGALPATGIDTGWVNNLAAVALGAVLVGGVLTLRRSRRRGASTE